MKKLLFLFFLCSNHIVNAQTQEEETYKQQGKEWNVEVNLDPFSANPINISYLRIRRFTTANIAHRLGISVSGETQKPNDDVKLSTVIINLRPGIEKHFNGTNRLSPYVGGELDLAVKWSKRDVVNQGGQPLKGAWDQNGQERGYTRIGFNLITGMDVYILKSLYLGTEIGYGFELLKNADIEFSNGQQTIDGGSSLKFGPNFNSSIRLGYIF
ncbi:MAG TPA: hypothetical protein PKL31_08290 [Fulvivirga sp.]|nr:hypothetical protein [Fulvivirga sp.]